MIFGLFQLWGVIRQGFKCKDCGLVVHRCCKDSAVAECRKIAANSTSWWSLTPDISRSSKKLLPSIRLAKEIFKK